MELKRIVAQDSQRANARAIELYGPDALIVSSTRVNGKVEVIVAVDIVPEPLEALIPTPVSVQPKTSEKSALFGALLQESLRAEPQERFDPTLETSTAPSVGAPVTVSAASDALPNTSFSVLKTTPAIEKNASQDASSNGREAIRAREIVDLVRSELAEIRREFRMSQKVDLWQSGSAMPNEFRPLSEALIESNVPATLRALLMDWAVEAKQPLDGLAFMESSLASIVKNKTSPVNPLTGVHVLAGPSGSGKTRMIGRIAKARAQDVGHESIALISFCDQRPGAWSQIQMIASKIGVDCFRVNSESMLSEVLTECATRSLILIDTPGILMAEHLATIGRLAPTAQRHLVLPVDASVSTIKRFLTDHHASWSTLILSKLDEIEQPWPLIQALCEPLIPVSFCADSQNPELLCESDPSAAIVAAAFKAFLAAHPQLASTESLPAEPTFSQLKAAGVLAPLNPAQAKGAQQGAIYEGYHRLQGH